MARGSAVSRSGFTPTVVVASREVSDTPALLRAAGLDADGDVVDGRSGLSASLNVAENLFLGHEMRALGMLRRSQMEARASELLTKLDVNATPRASLDSVQRAQLPILQIAQAVVRGRRIIVAADQLHLPSRDILAALSVAAQHGSDSVVVGTRVGPFLREGLPAVVVAAARGVPRVVLREPNGISVSAAVAALTSAECTPRSEAVDSQTKSPSVANPTSAATARTAALTVSSWTVPAPLDRSLFIARDFDLVVHGGEVVGVTGPGSEELMLSIYGSSMGAPHSGSVVVVDAQGGDAVDVSSGTAGEAFAAGLAYGTENPITYDLRLIGGVPTSVSPSALRSLAERGIISRTHDYMRRRSGLPGLSPSPPHPDLFTDALRQLSSNSRVVILQEPFSAQAATREHIIDDMRGRGMAVVIVSDDVAALSSICDRVIVVDDAITRAEIDRRGPNVGSMAQAQHRFHAAIVSARLG